MPIDMSGALKPRIDALITEAKKWEKSNNGEKAATCYRQAAFLTGQYADATKLSDIRQRRLDNAKGLLQLANSIEKGTSRPAGAGGRRHPYKAANGKPAGPRSSSGPANDASETEDDFESIIEQFITRSSVTWDDIYGLEETKKEIKLAYGLEFVRKPQGVNVRGWRKILLYGPPGTGKTLLAAATSNQLKATFYNVSLDSILSKWFGESSKITHSLFESASRNAPSVIFIDEIDGIAGKRGGEQSSADRRILNTFLTEMDGLKAKGEDPFVLIMAATNRPWDLDDAIVSRFEKNISVPLPGPEVRVGILNIHLTKTGIANDFPLEELADLTEGYSGRELEQIVRGLVMGIVVEMNPDLPLQVDQGPEVLSRQTLKLRPITRFDWEKELAKTPAKVTSETTERLRQWELSFE